MRFVLIISLLVTLLVPDARGQAGFQPVPGFPARQVYDLLIDKNGFLWIGHELGISRYDGTSFTHFSNPHQASLSITDLFEDRQGRIWCHNFSAQVFYIEKERMNLLEAYDYTKEEQFPRMVICGDELVITSFQGLFVCNTASMQSRYLQTAGGLPVSTSSLVTLGNKVVAYDIDDAQGRWYLYEGKGKLKILNADRAINSGANNFIVQPFSFNDTIYGVINPGGHLQKMLLQGNSIHKVGDHVFDDYLNTVTVDKGRPWVHTKKRSVSGQQAVDNLEVTDIVTGRDGNTWVGSLKSGLLVSEKQPFREQVTIAGVDKGDYVRRISSGVSTMLYSTQNGDIIVVDRQSGHTVYKRKFEASGIAFGNHLENDVYLVATSRTPYLIYAKDKKAIILDVCSFVKNAVIGNGAFLFASIHGIIVIHATLQGGDRAAWLRANKEWYTAMGFKTEGSYGFIFQNLGRCEGVSYDPQRQSILGSFKSGVYELSANGVVPFTVDGKKVFASSLLYTHDQLLIATYNGGLILRKGDRISRLTVNEGLSSNTILKMKVVGDHLWLFESNAVQIVDLKTGAVLSGIDLPALTGSTMLDVAEINGSAYISTIEGVYKVPLVTLGNKPNLQSYLNYALVNNRDTLLNSSASLPYDKNNIQFVLSSPWYNSQKTLSFKYRLLGGGDERWNISAGPVVRFTSLAPGQYRFESFATLSNGERTLNTTAFEFEIRKPWWARWWVQALFVLALGGAFYGAYRYRLRQLQRVESIRRNISSDLHDDIGATLSSINIYTELARRQADNGEFLSLIQENTRDIIGKLDDLVWSINPKNDTYEQLVNRMRSFSDPLLSGADINYRISCSEDLFSLKLNTAMKRNVYLIFKETVNNVVKHSRARNCHIEILHQKGRFHMQIADDGVGFEEGYAQKNRNGLKNIEERARQINAQLKIESLKGQGTTILLTASV